MHSRVAVTLSALFAMLLWTTGCAPSAGGGGGAAPADEIPDNGEDADGGIEGTIQFKLASEAAPDGGLAVQILAPDVEAARYPEGAPVMVMVAGGLSPGHIENAESTVAQQAMEHGYLHISFSMPGVEGRTPETSSGGVYDYRGPDCMRALADVVLYALGRSTDQDGQTITERVPFALTDNVGMAAFSHGGNLAVATLAAHGAKLTGLAWFVSWESPIGDQYVTAELGGGHSGERELNPYYEQGTCELTTCPWLGMDEVLAYDPTAVFLLQDPFDDENFDLTGVFYLDENENETLDDDEFRFSPAGGSGDVVDGRHLPQGYFSVELTEMIEAQAERLFAEPPPWLATGAEAKAYWADRDGSVSVDEAVAALPDLLVMSVASIEDHVQAQPDHPHVRGFVNGWLEAGGTFARLNSDAAYAAMVTGFDATDLPDNPANTEIPYPGIEEMLYPTRIDGDPVVLDATTAAGILELADRARSGDLSTNLDSVLYP